MDAAIAKIPIISTNCKFGPSEILEKGKYGRMFKVGDYLKLSKIMLLNTKIIKKIPNAKLKKNKLNLITKEYYELFFKKNI